MPIMDSSTGQLRRPLMTAGELRESANIARGYLLTMLHAAGSGHSGGCLSATDLSTALYMYKMSHDPENPEWEGRDRIIWSSGHKAPLLYLDLAMSGYDILGKCSPEIREAYLDIITPCDEFPGYDPLEVLMTLRKLYSPLEGHPNWEKMPGIEVSTGSLGQGLSIANGLAVAAKINGQDHSVYCMMGDGEQQEGQIWEAAMAAGNYYLDNLVGIIDFNRLQIDGWVDEIMGISPLADKYNDFGWHTVVTDGHDMGQILGALDEAEATEGKPTVIIAETTKGEGVSYMKDQARWHGGVPKYRTTEESLEKEEKDESLEKALKDLGLRDVFTDDKLGYLLEIGERYQREFVEQRVLESIPSMPSGKTYFWIHSSGKGYYLFDKGDRMTVDMDPTRLGFGRALWKHGDDEKIVCIGADISDSITISGLYKNPDNPKEIKEYRRDRFKSAGIAEANAIGIAAGFAMEGKKPVVGSYGVFIPGRVIDQLRTTVCYSNLEVLIASAHAGVSVGPDGATHQALEDISIMTIMPNMNLVVPCDALETQRATEELLFNVHGPKAIRFAREATPIVTDENTPFRIGEANIIRYTGKAERFIDAFETSPASICRYEDDDVTIVACGPMVPEAMRAAYILAEEYKTRARVINLHTLKTPDPEIANNNNPFSEIDRQALIRAAYETDVLLTLEEHQKGGLGNLVAAALLEDDSLHGRHPYFIRMGVNDRFGQSGDPWELTYEFGLAAENVVEALRGHS